MAIAAGVVAIVLGRAVITLQQLTPERGRTTRLDRVQRARLRATQSVRSAKRRTMPSYDVRQLELTTCRIRCMRMRAPHRNLEARGVGPIQQIQWRGSSRKVFVGQVKVAQRRADVAVAHESLDGVHIDPGF